MIFKEVSAHVLLELLLLGPWKTRDFMVEGNGREKLLSLWQPESK